jgi:hypothetical protein
MGTFAETGNVDYRLLFADQGEQISIFSLQKTNGSLPFPFSVCNKQTEVAVFHIYIFILKQQHIYIYLYLYIYTYIYFYIHLYTAVSNELWKRKPRRFFLICLLFSHHTNGSLSFVRLFMK